MSKTRIIASIDVGSSKITTLIGQAREDQDRIHIIGVSSGLSKGVRKGQVVDIEDTVSAIVSSVEAAERMAGINVSKAWVSIDGAHISSQNSKGVVAVSQPQGEIMHEDVTRVLDAARAVSLPSSTDIIHALPRTYTVDGQDGIKDPIGMTGVRLEVETHLVMGSSTAIKNLTRCISEVGCDVEGIVFGGFASGEACLSETERELGVILIDIGGGTTNVAIYIEGALSYSAVLPVGAINVTKDLAAGLSLSLESAERVKLFLGKMKASKEKDDDINLEELHLEEGLKTLSTKTVIEGIIRPRLTELFQAVVSEIKKSGFGGMTPAGVVLTGGGALTVGILESAKRNLTLPVRVGYPVGMTGLIDDINNPSFSASIGLLKYALKCEAPKENNFSLDNLPIKGALGKVVELFKSLLP